MATTVTAFTAQADAYLRSGGGLKALNAQAHADLLRNLTPEQRSMLTVYENAKRVYDGNAGDEMDWTAARALGAHLNGLRNLPADVPLESYNESRPYKNGKEALGRLLDIASGKAQSPSQTLEAYTQAVTAAQAEANAKRDALPLPEELTYGPVTQAEIDAWMAAHPDDDFTVNYQAATFDQTAFDADYGRRVFGLQDKPLSYNDYREMRHLTDDEARLYYEAFQHIDGLENTYSSEEEMFSAFDRPGWRWVPKTFKHYRDLEMTRAMAERTRTSVNARAFMAYWMDAAPSLPDRANELILRAYKSGTEGIDVEDEDEITLPSTGYENVSNHALYEGLSEKEKKEILPLLSMARGEVQGPQFWADLWTRLAQSSDRTFVNPFRFIGAMASDASTPIGAWLTGRDFDYGKWAAGKKEEAQASAALRAATQTLTYDNGGFFYDGFIGLAEQLPILGVAAAGGLLSKPTGGASLKVSAAFLALGYAEDTRRAALEHGADPFAASLLGLASGAVQGAIDMIQWGQLAGLADSAMLTVAKRNGAAAFTRNFLNGAVRRVGSPEALRFAQRVGSAYLADVFLESAQEGLQGMTDSLAQDLSLMLSGEDVDVKGMLGRSLTRFKDEFVQSLPTMMLTVGLAGGTHVVRETARGASAGRALHDLRVGRRETLPLIETKGLNATELRQRWRTTQGDAARVTLLTEALGSRNAAETAHALFKAEETLANRHRTLAIQQLVDMSSRAGARFAGDPKAIQDMLRGLGLDATVTQAKLADTDRDGKAVSRDGFLVLLRVGDKTIDLGLRAATEAEVSLDGSAASATSAWEAVSKVNAEVSKMGKGAFITRWQADADFRTGLIKKHKLFSTGAFDGVRPGLSVIVSRTNPETGAVERDTLPVGGLILLAQGGLSGEAVATNRSLAHETLHAVVRLLRDGGVLTADSELAKQARRVFGDPKVAGELFDEEAAAHRLAEESGLGMEAVDAMAGEVLRAIPDKGVRGLLRRAAGAFMDWLAGGDVVPVVDEKGRVTELSGDSRALGEVKDKASRGQRFFTALANALDDHAAEASEAWGKLQASRAAARQATLDALAREQVAKAQAAAEKAETAATEEERQDALREQQAAEAALDAALREQAEARDEQAARQLFALRGYLDEADRKNPDPKAVIPTLADSFAKLCRQPLPTKPAERNRALADRRAALKKWRDAKNRELDLLKLRAALGVDPAARLEYYVARENEAFRLEAREARKSIDDEKRHVKETPVAEGDALLANTRAVGHVEVESRESFVKRKMAENGWDRKTAIAQSTHLYPEDMQGLGVPPWASKQLYTGAGGHSPDTAAQALYDEGRIADPTVDAFWEAVRGDIETVSLSKQREIEAIEAEAAQAVERALALHRATLADIEQRDAEGGLPLPGDATPAPRREVTAAGPHLDANGRTIIQSDKFTIAEAKRSIREQNEKNPNGYTNKATGRIAFINGAQAREMTTESNIKKTTRHGFSVYEHLHAVALAPMLYENAALVRDDPDTKNGDPRVRIMRYASPIVVDRPNGRVEATAWLTVKTSEQHGNRVYSLELLELEEARRITANTASTALPRTRNLTNTIAQPRANVNPQEAFDNARRRLEVAGLYYGRAPEAAELSDRAIAEFAVAEESLRTGKRPSQAQLSQAFRDFGIHPGEQSGRSARRTLKLLNELGLAYDKEGNAVAVPKGALSGLLSRNERLGKAFDSAWSEAEAEAFSKGAASAFAAAREMAAETQALAKAHRDEAEAVLGMDPGILQAELGFDIEATLLADKANWQKLTPQQAEALAKRREEERRKALEEAAAAAQALQDGLPPPEPSLEELGLDGAGVAKLRKRLAELRKRWAELDREAEAKRRERELRFRERQAEEKEGKTEDRQEQEDADALLARKLELLKGVAFDIDDPVSVREFVNCMILHIAEKRAGTTFAAPVQLNRQLTDPLTVRDAARTLAQILTEMADRLAYGGAREHVKQAAMRLTMAETIGQTRALAVGAFASLRNALVRESQTEMRDQMVKAIDAVIQQGAFAVGREDSERRVTGDLERRLRAITQALTLGALGRARLREEAMAKLAGLQRDRSLDADTLCSMRDYLDAQRVIVSLNEYGGWRQMGLGELADLRDRLLRLVQTGLDEHERRIQQFEARVARITEPILAALNQNPPETKPGRHSKKAERLAAWLDEHLGLQNLLFETLLSRATGEVRAKGARAVRELLAAFTEASVTYEARKQVWQREAQNIITRVYGSVTAWQNRMREAIDDDHRKRISNRRTESQEQAGADPAQKTALTRGQVLQLYASVIQSDYALNARLHRRDGDCLEAMRECLDARDLQFLAEMSAFFRKIFPDLRDAYKAVTGVTVGTTPGYWPVRINYEREGLPARVRAWTPIVAAMEPRRRNSLDFREDVSVEEMVWGRIDEWAHMMGYGQMGILARAVLGDRHLREAIRNSLGDKLAKRIQENVLDALLGPETDPGAGLLLVGARYTSGMAMALNIGVALKQFAGIPAFAHAVGGRKTLRFWWAGVAKDAAFDRDWAILTQSPSFKARYGAGLNAEMKAALAGGEPGGFTGRASRFYSWGLQWQAWADKIVCRPFAVGAFREYRDAYLREGMAEDEAVRRAVIDAWAMIEATQQSSRPENQLRSVNKNRFFRYLAQFRSAPLQSLQWELRAFSAMLRGEEGARARFIKAVVVNHVFAPLFYVALDALWNEVILLGLWEDDDEEKERRYKRYCAELALQFLFGQLPAIPLYGNALEVFYSWIVKNAERKEEGRDLADLTGRELAQEMVDIPVVRTEANLVAAAASLAKDAVTLDWRSAASEIDDFAKTALAPVRDLQKAAKRGLGHDLDDLWEEDPAEKRRRVRRQMAEEE